MSNEDNETMVAMLVSIRMMTCSCGGDQNSDDDYDDGGGKERDV